APIAKAFIKNFGLKKGAIASSVAHDSHNIVAVGVDDESICRAVNAIIESKGGVYLTPGRPRTELARGVVGESIDGECLLKLPVAGLMSIDDGYVVAEKYKAMDAFVKKELGSTLSAPFMTLSFMALLVIPHLKLGDLGLFDGDSFQLIQQS
ncbi:MAG: adenine deaminase C-terminal domain-containing protein, partial [Bacteroidota bacterium]